MAELRALKQQRATIKGQVTRVITFFESPGEKTVAEAQVRLVKLQEYWSNFEEVQKTIESKQTNNEEEFQRQQQDGEVERQVFEDNYYRAAGMAQAILERDRVAQAMGNMNIQAEIRNAPPPPPRENQRHRPKLPEIRLPEFDGEFTKWMFFKNSFETTIHEDRDLTNMQKHQYLVGLLKGEALSAIQGFKISAENYQHAWQLLKDTYDNKIIIIESHLDELLKFPVITKENKADSIRQFVWHIRTHMTSLQSLGQPVNHWETLILHLAKKTLDFAEQRDWQDAIKNRTAENMPTMDEFLKLFTERCNTLRVLNQGKEKTTNPKPPDKKKNERRVSLTVTTQDCKFCGKDSHGIYKCEELMKLTPADRKKEVVKKRLCVNCLGDGHFAKNCRSGSCRKCQMRHNTLLHREMESPSKTEDAEETPAVVTSCIDETTEKPSPFTQNDNEKMVNIYFTHKPTTNVILSTARVYAYDIDGRPHVCRALLDPGSQSNLMTESFAKKLKLRCKAEHRPISGINQSRTSAGKVTEVRIESRHEDFTMELECLILPAITEKLPQSQIDVKQMSVPKNVQLADPMFDKPDKIDLLIGAGPFWKIIVGTAKNNVQGQPAWQNTRLGWIIGGEVPGTKTISSASHLAVTNDVLNQQIERFWRQEELPETIQYTDEENYCEQYFSDTVKRDGQGRFIVRLPQRENVKLGDSSEQALRRFLALERRFARDAKLKEEYVKFMDDYLKQGHMSLSKDSETQQSISYVLPHQAIVRPDSVTTKLRVVFDASAKTTLGTSLNDKLLPGPNLQRDLVDIILRFRTHAYVMTADVAMMYRQIFVDERDRALQRIHWRKDPQETVKLYELNTVTYGTTCAPFLAIRCLRELAAEAKDLENAARAINEDCYMDDVLTGAKTVDEAVDLQKQLSELLLRGKFQLRKWRANDSRILEHLAEACKTDELLTLDKEGALKTLGLLWNAEEDYLQYRIKIEENGAATKRSVLSKIAQVFDPLGLIAPLLINGKIIMQRLWLLEIDWDQSLPDESRAAWESYYTSLSRVNELRIARNVVPGNASEKFELFGFGDASEKAFGACLYAVSRDKEGNVHSRLICSKSKVAPLKTISMPRLELEAALLLAKLYKTAIAAYGERLTNAKLWSDSTIVLGWLKTPPNILKTFVANRISKIQALTKNTTWHHVPSEDNPADMLSRGITVDRLIEDKLWWQGPSWITQKSPWPENMKGPETTLPELKQVTVTLTATTATSILAKFSSYCKLKRVLAYCLRWRNNPQEPRKNHALTVDELERAEKTIAKMVQQETFEREINDLANGNSVDRKSQLRALDPVLDGEGLLRVGGRLRNSELSEDQKHQIILPAKHFVTNLIMKDEHLRLHHCPPMQLLHAVRHKFWPLSGRTEAQKATKACLPCYRYRPSFPEVKMGDLPAKRVCGFVRPFVTTGIDYAGPIQVRESRRRGRIHISKGYIAIFTCFSTKAVHVELVTELTTEAFMAALRRFTARRGICSQLFSDNATNFVGAARELKEIYEFLEKEKTEIAANLANQHVQWNFIPPRAPNFGGLWEAAVKVTKKHLYTMTRGLILTYEEYSTLLTEVEAILNSRPLTPLSNDPADLSVLTPSHFLIGEPLVQPAQHDLQETPDNRLSRWEHLQKRRQIFWRRWQTEYLQELQKRSKWSKDGENIELNTLVLLKEDNVSPLHWVLGRIIALFPGSDGIVRVVTVRTKNGSFKRAVRNLCPIPMHEQLCP